MQKKRGLAAHNKNKVSQCSLHNLHLSLFYLELKINQNILEGKKCFPLANTFFDYVIKSDF